MAYGVWLSNDIVGTKRTVTVAVELCEVGLLSASGEVVSVVVTIGGQGKQRRVRLLRVDTALLVHEPGLAEQVAGEEL